MLIKCCKKSDSLTSESWASSLAICAYRAHDKFYVYVLNIVDVVFNWRASEASEKLSGVYKFELVRYVYIYVWMYVCHNSSACHVYVMWAELDHSLFYMCQPFFIYASCFNYINQWKRHGH